MIRIKNTLIPQNTIKNIQYRQGSSPNDHYLRVTYQDHSHDEEDYYYDTEEKALQALTNIHTHQNDNPPYESSQGKSF